MFWKWQKRDKMIELVAHVKASTLSQNSLAYYVIKSTEVCEKIKRSKFVVDPDLNCVWVFFIHPVQRLFVIQEVTFKYVK